MHSEVGTAADGPGNSRWYFGVLAIMVYQTGAVPRHMDAYRFCWTEYQMFMNLSSSSQNFLGYPAVQLGVGNRWNYMGGLIDLQDRGTQTLNAILLHRDGPWGGANWKLYRKDNHPIVRYQKNHNVIGTTKGKNSITGQYFPDYEIQNFTEPPITSKYKPLMYSFPSDLDDVEVDNVLISHGNIRTHFTDHTKEPIGSDQYTYTHLDTLLPTEKSKLDIKKITYSPYASFKNYLQETKDSFLVQVAYPETIYPKELYTYLSGTRKRIEFKNDFWRDSRNDRTALDYQNAYNVVAEENDESSTTQTASIWKLDSNLDFDEVLAGNVPTHIPYSASMNTVDGVGELQNCYSLFHFAGYGGGDPYDIIPGVSYNRRIKLLSPDRLIFRTGVGEKDWDKLDDSISAFGYTLPIFSGTLVSPYPGRLSASVGDTFWEASSSAGEKPFYDSYDDYSEEGFRKLKNGTILPEFRISEKIDDYVDSGAKLIYNDYANYIQTFMNKESDEGLGLQNGLLSLTGAVTTSTTEEFLSRYTFSDFYKYFNVVRDDYQNTPSEFPKDTKHKLVCEAILKFLPYDGFYPADRCIQLGKLFMKTVDVGLSGDHRILRTALQPYIAPGVLFNSIKSGIAVDYPIFSDADSFTTNHDLVRSTDVLPWENYVSGAFDERVNLDDLLYPSAKSYTIIDAEVDQDTLIHCTASIDGVDDERYTFAMSNFLAETTKGFIGKTPSFAGLWGASNKDYECQKTAVYTMDIILNNSMNIPWYSDLDSYHSAMTDVIPTTGQIASSSYPYITSSLQLNSSSVTMYSRAITGYDFDPFLYGSSFGPPVHCGEFATGSYQGGGTNVYTPTSIDGCSFDPFTPPYYNGFAKVTLSVPLTASNFYSLETILNNITYTYDRLRTFRYPAIPAGGSGDISIDSAVQAATQTTAYQHAMQLSASLYLGDEDVNQILYKNSEGSQMLQIRPRWTCPVLDFTDASPQDSWVSTGSAGAKGMWHQRGRNVHGENNRGIKFHMISGENGANTSDLTNVLGFKLKPEQKIGEIYGADATPSMVGAAINPDDLIPRKFSEAIIAIPFKPSTKVNGTSLYKANKEQTKLIKQNLYIDFLETYHENTRYDPTARVFSFAEIQDKAAKKGETIYDTSEGLYDLMLMMRKYIMPPHMDFLHNDAIDPYTMFMLEFSVDIKKEDLENIWQNIAPTFGNRAILAKSETNMHSMPTVFSPNKATSSPIDGSGNDIPIEEDSFFYNDVFSPEDTRWAVFKVKQRAAMNYNSIIGKMGKDGTYIRNDMNVKQTNEFLYSYNWPYDFFSLIELAKIDSITTFNPTYNEPPTFGEE